MSGITASGFPQSPPFGHRRRRRRRRGEITITKNRDKKRQ
jgi:hypothetical protein